MKKSILLLTVILMSMNFTSCTKESISEDVQTQGCCGDGDIIPPPKNGG